MKPVSAVLRQFLFAAVALGGVTWFARSFSAPDRVRGQAAAVVQGSPQVVLVGNSLIRMGLDEGLLEERLGLSVGKITSDGSGTAFWYVVVDRVLGAVEPAPRAVVFLLRGRELTEPTMGVREASGFDLRALAGDAIDPLLEERVYEPALGVTRNFLQRHWSVLRVRDVARDSYERIFRNRILSSLLGQDKRVLTLAFAQVLGDGRMRRDLLEAFQLGDHEARLSQGTFAEQLPDSLLEPLLEELERRQILPVFVRSPRPGLVRGQREKPSTTRYVEDFGRWLESQGGVWIDASVLPGIELHHFVSGDHLGRAGARVLTEHLAVLLEERWQD